MRFLTATLLALASVAPFATHQSSPQLRPREVVSGEAAARVDDYLSRLVRHGFSGAVLIAKDGQVVLKRAYGMANRETGLPYDVDMVSCIGSVTKQFTGAAIMKLDMQGKLGTSDPIAKYLPGVPADKAGITIHHLLTHTAGFSGDLGGSDEEPIGRDALVAKVLAAPLVAKPGDHFEYSNEGFALAAAIVERVSGQGYGAFLRGQLFLPAGMTDTGPTGRAGTCAATAASTPRSTISTGRVGRRRITAFGLTFDPVHAACYEATRCQVPSDLPAFGPAPAGAGSSSAQEPAEAVPRMSAPARAPRPSCPTGGPCGVELRPTTFYPW